MEGGELTGLVVLFLSGIKVGLACARVPGRKGAIGLCAISCEELTKEGLNVGAQKKEAASRR